MDDLGEFLAYIAGKNQEELINLHDTNFLHELEPYLSVPSNVIVAVFFGENENHDGKITVEELITFLDDNEFMDNSFE